MKKSKISIFGIISIFALIFFFKYAIWVVLLSIVGALIYFIYKKMSERKAVSTNNIKSNNVSVLNYTPLTKDEPKSNIPSNTVKRGYVSANKILFDNNAVENIKNRYIAFDVETTGLSPYSDRIIEVGAVLFENGKSVKEYGTLVNPNRSIPPSATAVNHITNDMVRKAPSESKVYSELVDFLGDALEEKTIICAHNAKFDMDFLSQTLMRLGYDAKIVYVDTLSISRYMVSGLENYKQPTVANHFGIINEQAHRAVSDAKVCGMILSKLVEIKLEEQEKIRIEKERQEQEERLKREQFLKIQKEFQEKRDSITINPVNERISINEIRNFHDISKGYSDGYPFYCNGEVYRKSENFKEAINEYDKARYNGYCNLALYRSYAMAYHKLKDYENEIDILDEGVRRFRDDISACEKLEIRRNKAIIAFIEQQEKSRLKAEKKLKSEECQVNQISKVTLGRAVLQLSDDMTIIKKFESVAEASRTIGISEKCIRDAAKGVQKHAGGFVWKYADDFDTAFS